MTTSGGKNGRTPVSWLILQAGPMFLKESFAPPANDLALASQGTDNRPFISEDHISSLIF
jgi:hypothetical protein